MGGYKLQVGDGKSRLNASNLRIDEIFFKGLETFLSIWRNLIDIYLEINVIMNSQKFSISMQQLFVWFTH